MRPQWRLTTDDSWLVSETVKGWEKPAFDASAGSPPLCSATRSATVEHRRRGGQEHEPDDFGHARRLARHPAPCVAAAARSTTIALGRPHREQIVSRRESLATMLEASNSPTAPPRRPTPTRSRHWLRGASSDPNRLVAAIYPAALGRAPTSRERDLATELLGNSPTKDSLADLLWTIVMLLNSNWCRDGTHSN